MRKRFLIGLLLVTVAARLAAQEPLIERGVGVPMRDGVLLKAILLRPDSTGRWPTLVYRTPYGKDRAFESQSLHRAAAPMDMPC